MPKLKVLIVGASIAGPTAAYWFARIGADVTVIERFPHLRTNGQSVDIRTVGVTVMRRMEGMEAAVRDNALQIEGISFVRADGRPYGVIKPTGNPDQQSLVSEYEILRGDLSRIIVDMTKNNENVRYVFGEQIASMKPRYGDDGPITVEFTNGHPTAEFDLVVACDGASSRTRAMGLHCGLRDYMIPLNSWAAYFTTQQDLADGSQMGKAYSAPGGRFIALGADSSGANRVTLLGMHSSRNRNAMKPLLEAIRLGDDATKQYLAQVYKGGGWKCDEAAAAMMDSQDFYATEVVQIKLPSLSKGRFVLVGDAGYAAGPTGGGTSLALAGAYVLAGEIGRHNGDIAAGLKGYEETMRPIIRELQKIPPLVPTALAPQTSQGIWLRNNIFAFICWSKNMQFAQRLSIKSFRKNDKDKLPDYLRMGRLDTAGVSCIMDLT